VFTPPCTWITSNPVITGVRPSVVAPGTSHCSVALVAVYAVIVGAAGASGVLRPALLVKKHPGWQNGMKPNGEDVTSPSPWSQTLSSPLPRLPRPESLLSAGREHKSGRGWSCVVVCGRVCVSKQAVGSGRYECSERRWTGQGGHASDCACHLLCANI
jgi:hypothetical protein